MDESKVLSGAAVLEELADTHIVPNHFSTHLCVSTRDQHFRAMFGTSSHMAFLLWTIMDVAVEGPAGGHHVHMLWMLLFLKGYPNGDTLSGICCASTKTVHYRVDAFLEHASTLNLVSSSQITV